MNKIIDHPNSNYAKQIGPFRIRLLIKGRYAPSPNNSDSIFLDNYGTIKPPYTLIINSSYYGITEDVVEIIQVEMKIGNEKPVMLHNKTESNIRVPFKPWLDHAVSAKMKIGLGDDLPFIENEEVRVTVKLRLPESKELESISTLFIGNKAVAVNSKFWSLVLGG